MRPRRRVISLSPRLSFDVAVQMSFYSVDTSILDAAVQQLPHSILSQDVFSTQMGARPASSFSLDAAVILLHAVLYYAILLNNYR